MSEEIWDKFEFLLPPAGEAVWETGWEPGASSTGEGWDLLPHPHLIRKHDCMWVGTCLSKEHAKREAGGGDEQRSLLKPQPRRPDTPESEEECLAVAASEVTGQILAPRPTHHGGYGYTVPLMGLEDLGVQTPSETEEEEEEIGSMLLGEGEQEAEVGGGVRRRESRREGRVVKRKSGGQGQQGKRQGVGQYRGSLPESLSSAREETGAGEELRAWHNSMERKRRVEMGRAYDELRSLLPGLRTDVRTPKQAVLQAAISYCLELEATSRSLETEASALLRKQVKLRSHLTRLRKSLSKSR